MQRSRPNKNQGAVFPDGRHQQPATPHEQQTNTIFTIVAFRPTVQLLLLHKFQSSSTSPPAHQPSPPETDEYRRCRPRPVREKRREECESSGRRRIRLPPRLDGAFQFVTLIQGTPGESLTARQHPSRSAQASTCIAHRALGSPSTTAVGHWWWIEKKNTPSHQRDEVLQDTMKVRHSSDAAVIWQRLASALPLRRALSAQVPYASLAASGSVGGLHT